MMAAHQRQSKKNAKALKTPCIMRTLEWENRSQQCFSKNCLAKVHGEQRLFHWLLAEGYKAIESSGYSMPLGLP